MAQQSSCPSRAVADAANAASVELENLKDCDVATFDRIQSALQSVLALDPPSIDPVCRPAVVRARTPARQGVESLAHRRHECSLVTMNLVYSYTGSAEPADLAGLTLNGKPVQGSLVRAEPGRQQFVLAHTPSSGHEKFSAVFKVDKSAQEPVAHREGEKTYVTNALPGQEMEISVEISGKQFLPAFVVASVRQDPNSQAPAPAPELLSRQAIRLKLGSSPLAHDGGVRDRRLEIEVNEGAQDLVVEYPASTESRWYHLRAEYTGAELPTKTSRPGRASFELSPAPGQTTELKLFVDTGPRENWMRPYAIIGGGLVAAAGSAILVTKVVEAMGHRGDKEDQEREGRLATDPDAEAAANAAANEAYREERDALRVANWAIAPTLLGLGVAAVGLFWLEPGIPDPQDQAALQFSPLIGQRLLGGHLRGHW